MDLVLSCVSYLLVSTSPYYLLIHGKKERAEEEEEGVVEVEVGIKYL